MPAVTRLSIINDALSNTGNATVSQADLDLVPDNDLDENSDLYLADRAARAYNSQLKSLLSRHPWPFAKATEALEQADEDDNPSNRFGYAYDWPYFALWLDRVESPGGSPIPYEIIGRFICMDYDGTDDDAPVATFTQNPPATDISDLFWEALQIKLEVAILRSVNEDYGEANTRDKDAENRVLPMVRTRTDQQQPARKAFRSTMLERRRSGGGPRAL